MVVAGDVATPPELDELDAAGHTPLSLACAACTTDAMPLALLEAGASATRAVRAGRSTPLHEACVPPSRLSLVTQLLRRVPSADMPTAVGGITPLMTAAENNNAPVARLLLDSGAAVDAADAEGRTALHWAAVGGAEAVAGCLLAAGADRGRFDSDGNNPLQLAEGENMRALLMPPPLQLRAAEPAAAAASSSSAVMADAVPSWEDPVVIAAQALTIAIRHAEKPPPVWVLGALSKAGLPLAEPASQA